MAEIKPKKFTITVEIPTIDQVLENLRKSFPVVKFEVEYPPSRKEGETPDEPQTPPA